MRKTETYNDQLAIRVYHVQAQHVTTITERLQKAEDADFGTFSNLPLGDRLRIGSCQFAGVPREASLRVNAITLHLTGSRRP